MHQIKHIGFCTGDSFMSTNPDFIRGLHYCVDNDKNKWGTKCRNIRVSSPNELLKEDKDSIFIHVYSSVHYRDISIQLEALGFTENEHFGLADYGRFFANSTKIIFNAAFITYFGPRESDYYEFGVYKGNSFIDAYRIITEVDRFCELRYKTDLRYEDTAGGIHKFRSFCFDSFEGLPKPIGIDTSGIFSEGDYKCDADTFVSNIKSAGIDTERVEVIKGWYSDLGKKTLKEYHMKTARIIHIDCDLYESTRDVLAFCTSIVTDGTIIIFDDWFHFRGHPWRGEQKAFREWQEASPHLICTEYMREYPFRNSFIVNFK